MKILIRYVATLFLKTFLVFLVGLSLLFILIHATFNIDNILELKNRGDIKIISFLGRYYTYKLLEILTYTLPVAALFSAAFSLIRLQKNNELTAIATSAIHLNKIVIIFIFFAILTGVCIFIISEFALPAVSNKITRMEAILREKGIESNDIFIDETDQWAFAFYVKQYNYKEREMRGVVVDMFDKLNQERSLIIAERIKWDKEKQKWMAYNGVMYPYQEKGLKIIGSSEQPYVERIKIGYDGMELQSKLSYANPKANIDVLFCSLDHLFKLSKKYPQISALSVKLYTKMWYPLCGLLLVLIGIPYVISAKARESALGLGICFLTCIGFFSIYFLFTDLGNRGVIAPVAASLAPFFLSLAFGLFSFLKLQS